MLSAARMKSHPSADPAMSHPRRALLRALGVASVGIAGGVLPSARAREPRNEALQRHIEALRAAGDPRIGAGSAGARAMLARVYDQRDFAPFWTDETRASRLLHAVEASSTHGWEPSVRKHKSASSSASCS
jgi:hypothetical protein